MSKFEGRSGMTWSKLLIECCTSSMMKIEDAVLWGYMAREEAKLGESTGII